MPLFELAQPSGCGCADPGRNASQSRFANSGSAPGRDWCSSVHTVRDKSLSKMAESRGIQEMAASQSNLTCRRIFNQIQVNCYREPQKSAILRRRNTTITATRI